MNRNSIAVAIGLTLASLGSTASALEDPFTQETFQIQGHLGGGIYLGDGDLNPYGFGFGARGGYTFDLPIYVGGLLDYYIGESEELGGPFARAEISASSLIFQIEGGYDLGITDIVVIRPKIGLGMTHFFVDGCVSAVGFGGCEDDSETEFAFQLGVEAPIDLGPVFISPDFRFNIVSDASALILGVGVGGVF